MVLKSYPRRYNGRKYLRDALKFNFGAACYVHRVGTFGTSDLMADARQTPCRRRHPILSIRIQKTIHVREVQALVQGTWQSNNSTRQVREQDEKLWVKNEAFYSLIRHT